MVGKDRPNDLDRLLDEVSRGQRRLDSIRDPKLREAVRVALRIHQDTAMAPDQYTRMRMRARVMSRLDPRGPSLLDNAWTALELLAKPAPYIVRGIALAAVLVAGGLSATVVAADTLPDDLLYPVKIASEAVRLALAVAPDDRASVELSIAEHRLAEAEKLASSGRTSDALVASAMYSEHVASAAAELVPNDMSPVAQQLEAAFTQQRDRAQTLSSSLSTNTRSAAAAQILATIAKPTLAPGLTAAERVAETAAGVAQQLAAVAEHDAAAAATATVPVPVAASPTGTTSPTAPRATATAQTAPARPTETAHATATVAAPTAPTLTSSPPSDAPRATSAASSTDASRANIETQQKASEVLQTVRKAADGAKAAADRTKNHK